MNKSRNFDKDGFGRRIRELRVKAGLTQSEVAENLTISLDAYRSIEQGRRIPALPLAEKIADFFGVTLTYLVKGLTTAEILQAGLDEVIKMLVLLRDSI